MTLEEAKQLQYGNMIHAPKYKNADGTPQRARVTSVKTWKTRPGDIRVRATRGLREHWEFWQHELHMIERGEGRS